MGFWDRFRSASAAPPAAVLTSELALSRPPVAPLAPPRDEGPIIQPGQNLWRSYPADSIDPERYRVLQRWADIGQVSWLMELFDDIASDYHVAAQLRTRKLAVAGAPVLFESGDKSDVGKVIADEAALFFELIPNRVQLCVDLLDAVYRGFACCRPIWDSINGKWQVVGHEAIESRFFYFLNAVVPLITLTVGSLEGIPIPLGYLYHTSRDKAGPVIRGGVGRSVGKLWVHKGYALVDTASYLERFGTPHVQVTMDRSLREGDPEIERIKSAARAFITDQIGLMPAGATIAVIEAVNKAATVKDVFIVFMDFCDLGISKAILGQVLTADAGPGGIGNGGSAREQGEVRQDLKELDAAQLQQTLTAQLIAPWTLYHYGPSAPVPKLTFKVAKPDDQVAKTLAQKQRAEGIAIMRGQGLAISVAQMYEEFELVKPSGADDTLEAPTPPPVTPLKQPGGVSIPPP